MQQTAQMREKIKRIGIIPGKCLMREQKDTTLLLQLFPVVHTDSHNYILARVISQSHSLFHSQNGTDIGTECGLIESRNLSTI